MDFTTFNSFLQDELVRSMDLNHKPIHLWTRPLLWTIINSSFWNELVYFMSLLINSSTLWTNKLVHFMDLVINSSTLWT